ncbi:metallophosphoesterase [Nocardioides limicola]|uniref:metallophosphoesterase n=1 Tax=Nocardioides limicola TaxID=2803368 RepID=UPI001EF101DD|nr:metallophosphoesterase [Nocardioides sp. DJM-14]
MDTTSEQPRSRRSALRYAALLGLVAVWLVVTGALALTIFTNSSRTAVIASHDAVVTPTMDGLVTLRSGPFLPDIRVAAGGRVGADVRLGKTEARTVDELINRYALMAANPEGQVERLRSIVQEMAVAATLRGLAIAVVPLVLWWLLGPQRRRMLVAHARGPSGLVDVLVVALLAVIVLQPWRGEEPRQEDAAIWVPLTDYLDSVPMSAEAAEAISWVELRSDATTAQTRRLLLSLVDTFDTGQAFYREAAVEAGGLELRQPEDGETVVVLVADRHDNIGMDKVARAVGDAAGATGVLNAGDDTSTGQPWEAFSLDSVQAAFADVDRWVAPGNHDHGEFVPRYLADRGWQVLSGEVVDGPDGGLILGHHDPRASGLGNWRDVSTVTLAERAEELAEAACAHPERIGTLLVHDAAMGRIALSRGCVDLVLGGHLHTRDGPHEVVGENGMVGHRFTVGTTGGAAYAVAVGSKPRRPADMALITYADGRPVGLQGVMLQTNGVFVVSDWVPLRLSPLVDETDVEESDLHDSDVEDGGEDDAEPDGDGDGRPEETETDVEDPDGSN